MNTHSFSVVGKGHFPLDMLRYDACWPDSPDSVARLEANQIHIETVQVDLIGNRAPTVARWNSFGWSVK